MAKLTNSQEANKNSFLNLNPPVPHVLKETATSINKKGVSDQNDKIVCDKFTLEVSVNDTDMGSVEVCPEKNTGTPYFEKYLVNEEVSFIALPTFDKETEKFTHKFDSWEVKVDEVDIYPTNYVNVTLTKEQEDSCTTEEKKTELKKAIATENLDIISNSHLNLIISGNTKVKATFSSFS